MSRTYEALKKAEEGPLTEELKPNDFLVVVNDPESQAAQQFKKVCINILQGNLPERKTVLIASSLPSEGKSVVAANLAIGLAQTPETEAVLIDADLRKANLHKMMGISIDKGLKDYLEGKAISSEILYKTSIPRLLFVPSGRPSKHPEELLSSPRMKDLIDEIREKYPKCCIVIDSTPILLTSESDILLNQADGVIIVVQYGKTQKDALGRSLKFLDKRKIIGIIFNRIDYRLLQYKYGYSPYY